jgi:thymidine phosphorylase
MSKKLAEGLDALVLDVKWGSGAFMKTADEARALARSLVATGQRMVVATTALVTDMNQPLGRMAGNAVEINESVAMLEGRGPADLVEVTLSLGAELLASTSGRRHPPHSKGREQPSMVADGDRAHGGSPPATLLARETLQNTIDTGAAREKLAKMVRAQGGDLDAPRHVAPATEITAPTSGYLAAIDAEQLGRAIIALRGGRQQLDDLLDHSTGLEMLVRLGDRVDAGQPLVRVFARPDGAEPVRAMIPAALRLADDPPTVGPLILERVG